MTFTLPVVLQTDGVHCANVVSLGVVHFADSGGICQCQTTICGKCPHRHRDHFQRVRGCHRCPCWGEGYPNENVAVVA